MFIADYTPKGGFLARSLHRNASSRCDVLKSLPYRERRLFVHRFSRGALRDNVAIDDSLTGALSIFRDRRVSGSGARTSTPGARYGFANLIWLSAGDASRTSIGSTFLEPRCPDA
jgi:hypothetical protein